MKVGLLSEESPDAGVETDHGGDKGWLSKTLSHGGSSLALAFLCNKALFPIRTPITLALTPPVARFLRKKNLIKSYPN